MRDGGGKSVPVSAVIRLAQDRHNGSRPSIERQTSALTRLTPRESAVLARLRQGKPNKIIAHELELNAIERVWLYLRERFLSHRLWPTHDDILDACCAAWNALLDEAGRIRSLCSLDWATPVST